MTGVQTCALPIYEVFDKYANEETKFLTSPATYKQDEYYDDRTGQITGKNPLQIRGMGAQPTTQPSAVQPPVARQPEVAATTPTVQTSGGEDVYRFENLSAPAKERLNAYARDELGLKGDAMNRPDASELFNKMPLEQRRMAFQKAGETPVVSQQVSTRDATTRGTVPSYSEAKAIFAGQVSFSEKSGAKAREATGTRQGDFESAAVDAGKDLQNANVMLNIIEQHPEAVGLGYKNRALGATIEGVKLLTGKDIEPLARRATLGPEAIEAGNKFDALAETNNLKFRQIGRAHV